VRQENRDAPACGGLRRSDSNEKRRKAVAGSPRDAAGELHNNCDNN
jgi:hypothetical protein